MSLRPPYCSPRPNATPLAVAAVGLFGARLLVGPKSVVTAREAGLAYVAGTPLPVKKCVKSKNEMG